MRDSKNKNQTTLSADLKQAEELKREIISDLHLETAKIPWTELQRFFAGGKLLLLDAGEDMLEVAACLVANDVDRLQSLINENLLVYPDNDKAKRWVVDDAQLWAVVLNPWVLVQENIS